jgi:Ni/Co efflux regulator RcnB
MKRIVCSLVAAGAAALALASPARADTRFEPRDTRYRYASEWRREHEWRRLYWARRHFYAHWNGNPWERARFERWYAHRCDELRGW